MQEKLLQLLFLHFHFLFLLFWKHSVPVSDAAEAAETEEATTEATEATADEAADETAEEADAEAETEEDADASEEEAEEPAKDIVMKDDAAEADFDGVWKLSGLRVFGEALNADDYGMDSSFLTIKDGKLDIYAASEKCGSLLPLRSIPESS